MKITEDQQKGYSYPKRKDIEFEVRDQVVLKLSPWKGIV